MKIRLLLTLMALMLLPIIGNLIGWNAYAYLKIGSRDLIWGASHGVSHVAIAKHDHPDPELFMGMDMLADIQKDILISDTLHVFLERRMDPMRPLRFEIIRPTIHSDYRGLDFPWLLFPLSILPFALFPIIRKKK